MFSYWRLSALALVLLVSAAGAPRAAAQGLLEEPNAAPSRSGKTFATFSTAYKSSVAWRTAMRVSTSSACSRSSGSLCSSSLDAGQQAALKLAAAPQAYDAREAFGGLGSVMVGPVKDQAACGTCVAFTVLGVAQTAAAVGLRTSFRSTLSEHDFFFCKSGELGFMRNCEAGLTMREGVTAWLRLQRARTLPVLASCQRYVPSSTTCSPSCTTTLPELLRGEYKAEPLSSIVSMQRHIRQHGSIMCSIRLYSDLRTFFNGNNRLAVYRGPGKGAVFESPHAVQVVGYNNPKQAWLVKNSWGDGWANEGYGWVSFTAPGMCDPDSTYGFIFTPQQPPAAARPALAVVPGRNGCYRYRAVPGDYPEGLASRFGMQLQQLLLDNLQVIKDPSTVPPGVVLTLCGVSSASLAGAVVAGRAAPVTLPKAAISSSSSEVAALLAIKAVLDPPGAALRDWVPGSANPCHWKGVGCDRSKRLVALQLWDVAANKPVVRLSGRLPSGALLRRLPALNTINLHSTGVGGTLPEDYSQLSQLQILYLSNNALTGTLPPSYGRLTKLRQLGLWGNRLRGPLPAAWSGMAALQTLDLSVNALTGPLPPSYGHLTKMQLLYLNINKLSGPLPGAWSGMTVLEEVVLANNALAGPAPPSWGSWARVKVVVLFGNPQLRGCLPRAWRGKVNMNKRVEAYLISPYKGSNPLTAGTGITGFC